ncbi:hypothetical protein D9C73_017764 [Collichthys lucidus]|uniref:Uncharacterized protein n=1 Tax=Collichthys lucidus TaxID=240159 RepID=A0A4U5V877_COLLU|nr:hypothetical protein D9C73_017764 [Collichthys lucidus]
MANTGHQICCCCCISQLCVGGCKRERYMADTPIYSKARTDVQKCTRFAPFSYYADVHCDTESDQDDKSNTFDQIDFVRLSEVWPDGGDMEKIMETSDSRGFYCSLAYNLHRKHVCMTNGAGNTVQSTDLKVESLRWDAHFHSYYVASVKWDDGAAFSSYTARGMQKPPLKALAGGDVRVCLPSAFMWLGTYSTPETQSVSTMCSCTPPPPPPVLTRPFFIGGSRRDQVVTFLLGRGSAGLVRSEQLVPGFAILRFTGRKAC